MIREKRRRKRMLKRLLTVFFITLLVVAVSAFIVVKVFVIKTVHVKGNKLYDQQLITETVLNDEYSWNSLYVLLKYTFIDTKEVPFIDTMEIKLNSPSTITIEVYEKGMLGYIPIPTVNQMAYFDKDGFVVETSARVIENIPKIEGITCEEVVLLEKLPIDSKKLRDMLTLTQTLKREGLEPDAIHFGRTVSPVLKYGQTEVWLGSMELLTQKVTRLNEILPEVKGMNGVLHLENWTEETTNIVFEKSVEVEEEETEGEKEGEDSGEAGEDGEAESGEVENADENNEAPQNPEEPQEPQDDVSNLEQEQ